MQINPYIEHVELKKENYILHLKLSNLLRHGEEIYRNAMFSMTKLRVKIIP